VVTLEDASRFVDRPQALRYLLALGVGHQKDAIEGRDRCGLELTESRLAIAMTLPSRMGHGHEYPTCERDGKRSRQV
jgi:hypothetical protein